MVLIVSTKKMQLFLLFDNTTRDIRIVKYSQNGVFE